MIELKPCPFCGGEATSHFKVTSIGGNSDTVMFYVRCKDCGTEKAKKMKTAPDCDFEDLIDAVDFTIEMWNRRVEP